jgi:hypothetical protein
MPSGNSSETAHQIYNSMFSAYLGNTAVPRVGIDLTNVSWIAVGAAVLIGFLYLYARYSSSVHRSGGELYGASAFGGAILERIGGVSLFDVFVWGAVILYSAYFLVAHILFGQVYIPGR